MPDALIRKIGQASDARPQMSLHSIRAAAIAVICLAAPSVAFGNCVLQTNGTTVICDTSAPNPFPTSINANPTTGGTITIPTTGASVIVQSGAAISSSGAAIQVRNNSTVTNSGSVSTSLINGYGIWAGDPTNSTSTTAGYGNTLQNSGSIVTTGPNAIGLFARSYNKTTGDVLINNGAITTSGSIAGNSNNASSAGIRSETVAPSTILNIGTVTAKGAFATIGLYGVGGDGVEMAGPGTFTNAAGASVTSANAYGLYGNGANANGITVDNAGTITGGRAAILFGSGLSNNTVILEPGSVEGGDIDGGKNSINSNLIFNGLTSSAFANAIPHWQLVTLRSGANVVFTAPSYALQNLSLAVGTVATFSTQQMSINGTVANDGALVFANPNAATIAATIQGTGTLTQRGPGTLTLTGPNSYTGTTTVQAGTLAAGAVNTLPSLTAVTVAAPGTLDLAGFNQSIGSLAGAGNVTLGSATLSSGNDNTSTIFSGVISGSGALNKVGNGTFILTGSNVYASGTTIAAGTLQLGDGGASGSIVGNVIDNGNLVFNRSDTVTFSGAISGAGSVQQIGAGTTILNGVSSYTGNTTVSAGTLVVGDSAHVSAALSGGGPIYVARGATFGGFGSATGSVTNDGVIVAGNATPGFGTSPAATFAVGGLLNRGTINLASDPIVGNILMVRGAYVGANGRMNINTFLASDNSPTDKLIVNGGPASGTTVLFVNNANGPGALTIGNGIQVVQAINGATTTPTAFTLGNALISGAYQYRLFYGGIGADANDQSWYLRDTIPVSANPTPTSSTASTPSAGSTLTPISTVPIYRSEVPVYLTEPELANQFGFAMVDNLHARMGDDYPATAPVVAPPQAIWCKDPKVHYRCVVSSDKAAYYKDARAKEIADYQTYGMWGRIFGEYGTQKPSGNYGLSTNNAFLNGKGPNYDYSLGGIQAGFDIIHSDHSDGSRDRAGIYLGYGLAHADVKNVYDNGKAGKVDLSGESLGAYWTHYGQAGWYIDNVLQATYFDRVHASGSNSSMTTDGWSGIASIEGGYPFKIGAGGWTIEPQVQAIYQHVELGSGRDAYGGTSFGNTDDVHGRIGARLSRPLTFADGRLATIWARVNIWHDFMINRPGATFTNVNGFNPVSLNGSLGGTWSEIDAGASAQINKNWSAFGSVFYDHSIDNGRSFAVGGRAGLKWVW